MALMVCCGCGKNQLELHHHDAIRYAGPTREDRARKLWELLGRVSPSKFTQTVEPLLREFYSDTVLDQSQPLTTEEEKMCLRNVVEIVLPLKEVADILLRDRCINTGDHRDLTNKSMKKRKRWEQFFDIMKNAMNSKPRAYEVFEHYMKEKEIPKSDNLNSLLSEGLVCVCNAPPPKQEKNHDKTYMCMECRGQEAARKRAEATAKLRAMASSFIQFVEAEDKWLREPEDWYPEVRPPAGRKEDIFDPEQFRHIDDRAKNAPEHLQKSFDELVVYLTAGLTSDLGRLRAVFAWLGAQNLVSQTDDEARSAEPYSPEAYVREAARHTRYISTLFALLCRKAGLPCFIVQGSSKCGGYDAGDQSVSRFSKWVVVHVDGHWRFVHPYNAFQGRVNSQKSSWLLVEENGQAMRKKASPSEGNRQARFKEFWFLTDPDQFNVKCHSENPKYQLLHSPWSTQDFVQAPYLKEDYFKSPWKLLNAFGSVLEPLHGTCCMDFQHPVGERAELRYKLYYNEELSGSTFPENKQLDMYVVRLRECEGIKSLLIRLPVAGVYKIEVKGVYKTQFSFLGEFRIICKVAAVPHPFPINPTNGFGFDETVAAAGLTNPSHTDGVVPVKARQGVTFKFQIGEGKNLRPRLRHHTLTSEDLASNVSLIRKDGDATIRVSFPTDEPTTEYALEIDVARGAGVDDFINVLNYLLTSDKDAYDVTKDESKEIHKLFAALQGDKADQLDRAVGRYNGAGYTDPLIMERIKAKEAEYEAIRSELLAAVRSRNIERIDYAMKQFLSHKLADRGDLHKAVQRICCLGESVVRQAMSTRSVDHLGLAMERVMSTQAEEEVRQTEWYQEAERLLEQLQCSTFLTRALTTTALLGLGKLPATTHLLNVMKATYLLLGENPRALQNWVSIKTRLQEKGKKGLAHRIKTFDPEQLLMTHVSYAEDALRVCDPDVVRRESHLAGRLYDWCTHQIAEFRSKK